MLKTTRTVPFLVLFITLACFVSPAMAQNNYFSWNIGISQMEVKNITGLGIYAADTITKQNEEDDVTAFSIAYGHRFPESPLPLRMEIELSFRSSLDYSADPFFTVGTPGVDYISSDINSHTLFANFYIDLLPNSSIIPYVGGGIGIAWNIWENDAWSWWDDSETSTEFAWNVRGGIAMKLNRRLMLDLSYRYIDFGEAELPELLKIADITTNEFMLGLRLTF